MTNFLPKVKTNQADAIGGTIPLAALKAAVTKIGTLTDIKTERIPALRCVTLAFSGTVLTVAHYNTDQSLTKTIETGQTGHGVVALPYNQLTAFLAAADGGEVAIFKTEAENACRLTAGRFEAAIFPIDREPSLGETYDAFKPARSVAFGDGVLSHVLALTMPCVSSEETRYYLNGICLEFHAGRVLAIATDGHRLGVRGFNTPGTLEAWTESVIVPRQAIKAIASLIAKGQGSADFYHDAKGRKHYRFCGDGWTIWGKAIDGTYPEWRRVVPSDAESFALVKSADLVRFTKAARPGAFGNNSVAMQIMPKPDGIGLYMKDHDSMSEFSTTIYATLSGKECPHIGFNAAYMSAVAKAFGVPYLKLGFKDSGHPVKITAPDSPADELMILMPMRF